MKFIEFLPKHLALLDPVADEDRMDSVEMGKKLAQSGPCLTLVDGKDILACGGLVLISAGVAEIWVRVSKKVGPHAARELRVQMYRWIEENHLERLQATTPDDWQKNIRFLEWLGLKREKVFIRYSWVRKWQ